MGAGNVLLTWTLTTVWKQPQSERMREDMEALANPINRLGDRNIDCPHYRSCLDHAVKFAWNYWDCSGCDFKMLTQSLPMLDCSPRGADLYYSLPVEIYSKISLS